MKRLMVLGSLFFVVQACGREAPLSVRPGTVLDSVNESFIVEGVVVEDDELSFDDYFADEDDPDEDDE